MNPRASALVSHPTVCTIQNTPHPALHVGTAELSLVQPPIHSSTFFASSVRIRLR
jgi:hypothetical protein